MEGTSSPSASGGHGAERPQGPFARVMACVAMSPSTEAVVREGARLAAACGADLAFLHVGSQRDGVERAVREAAEAGEAPAGVEVIGREGRPDRVILEEARRIGADLIFAGALRSDPLLTGIVGSVARRLARNADRSLFLSIHRFPPEGVARSVVVSVLMDDRSREMLRAAMALARRGGAAELHIVHEFDPYSVRMSETTGAAGPDAGRWKHVLETAKRFELANFLDGMGVVELERAGVLVRTSCVAGRGGEEITRYAEGVGAELLVMPAPERKLGLFDRFFGHPTETLLEQFPCSVLLYRRAGAGESAASPGATG